MSVQERERSRARGGRAVAGVDERAEVGDLERRSGASDAGEQRISGQAAAEVQVLRRRFRA